MAATTIQRSLDLTLTQRSRLLVSRHSSVAALVGYVLLSVLLLGVRVLAHPARDFVGGMTTDPQIFIWSFAWWPHAVLHGQNPLVTHDLWTPIGVNLTWTASSPGLAIVLSPITLAFGPIVAYNVAALLMPALSAWTAYLLCLRLTNSAWASLAGGYVFGFSTYELGATLGHVHTSAVFLIPLAVLLVLRFLDAELSGRQLALRLGALLAVQLLLSTEILFTLTLAYIAMLILAALLVPRARPRLPALVAASTGAYALAAVVTSPFLYYVVKGGSDAGPPPGNDAFVGDALNLVVPTHISALGWWANGVAEHFPANDLERGTYLGIPTLLIVALFALRRGRTPGGRLLLAAFLLGALATLGSWLTVDGHRLFDLPWRAVASQRLFAAVMPSRFSLYMTLAAAVMVAIWAASRASSRGLRVALPLLSIVAVLPNVALGTWAGPGSVTLFSTFAPTVPELFTSGRYRDCIRKGETVVAMPFGARSNSMIWQVDSGFWFKLAGGYIEQHIPDFFLQVPSSANVALNTDPDDLTTDDVRSFSTLAGASVIVVDSRQEGPLPIQIDQIVHPVGVQGTLIYRLRGTWPDLAACDAGT